MSIGAPTNVMPHPAAANETMPTAGTIGAEESVSVYTQVITLTPLKPIPRFTFVVGWDGTPLRW